LFGQSTQNLKIQEIQTKTQFLFSGIQKLEFWDFISGITATNLVISGKKMVFGNSYFEEFHFRNIFLGNILFRHKMNSDK
jgi:hypothetical protein